MSQVVSTARPPRSAAPGVLTVRDIQSVVKERCQEVSGEVDGDRVFFRVPLDQEILCRAEPFLGLALLEAMFRNVEIHLDASAPVSEKLYRALPELQRVYACWNTDLKPVAVHARVEACSTRSTNVASFYSAGVDGSHTLCRHLAEISHLVMLSVECVGESAASWKQAVEKNTRFARGLGKQLMAIETNAKQWTDQRRIRWGFAQGLVLASLAPMLNAKRVYLAATHTYRELFPWGSHPLTDPMWSTEATAIIHDGAAVRRSEKIRELCRHPELIHNLKVCLRSLHENCGKCVKCIGTMTALYLLGASSRALPPLEDPRRALRALRAINESGASHLVDCMILAQQAGNVPIYRTLNRYYTWYQLRRTAKLVDRLMLRGLLGRTCRAVRTLRRSVPSRWRVEMRGREDWQA